MSEIFDSVVAHNGKEAANIAIQPQPHIIIVSGKVSLIYIFVTLDIWTNWNLWCSVTHQVTLSHPLYKNNVIFSLENLIKNVK